MYRRPLSGASRRLVAALVLAAVGLGGCGSDPGSDPGTGGPPAPPGTATSGSVVQSTTLPADWPTGLTVPDGASVVYSTADGSTLSAMFDAPQDLPALRAWFDGVVTAMGHERKSDASFAEVLALTWSDGSVTISVTATPAGGRTSGLLVVEPA